MTAINGLGELIQYFKNPANHKGKNLLHVSDEELASAKGKVSEEAERYIDALLYDNNKGYMLLRGLQKEGRSQDLQVSMRDLYAAQRGSGYEGEDISEDLDEYRTGLNAALTEVGKKYKLAEEIASKAVEYGEEKIYYLTLKPRKRFPMTIVVDERHYDGVKIGQDLSDRSDDCEHIMGEFAFSTVWVTDKDTKSKYSYLDRNGKRVEIEEDLYRLAVKKAREKGKYLAAENYMGRTRLRVSPMPLAEMNIVARKPLPRYFVEISLESSNSTFGQVSHQLTIEVPKQVYDKAGELWTEDLSGGALMAKGIFSSLEGKIVRKWVENDPNNFLVTTAEGQHFIVPK